MVAATLATIHESLLFVLSHAILSSCFQLDKHLASVVNLQRLPPFLSSFGSRELQLMIMEPLFPPLSLVMVHLSLFLTPQAPLVTVESHHLVSFYLELQDDLHVI